jgi:hypothetical protein
VAVDISLMLDPHHQDEHRVVIHRIHHTVRTASGRPIPGELPAQRFAHSPALLEESSGYELHHSRRDWTRETFEGSGGAGRDPELEQAHCAKKRDRNSADVRYAPSSSSFRAACISSRASGLESR